MKAALRGGPPASAAPVARPGFPMREAPGFPPRFAIIFEMDEIRHDPEELRKTIEELQQLEEEERRRLVSDALGKFNFFIHVTAWLAGCAYLVLLGVFVPEAIPWVFIPIGVWTAGLAWHGWRAWHPDKVREKKARKALKRLEKDMLDREGPAPDSASGCDTDPASSHVEPDATGPAKGR